MLSQAEFLPTVQRAIPRFQSRAPNPNQLECIDHSAATPLMIVAGPGSGKTTVLVLRALRLVFVEGYLPEQVLLTTFTRKAADEMRARLIEWGLLIVADLARQDRGPDFSAWLDQIDINRFVSGTLDSICEDVMIRLRDPNDPAVVLVEEFVADALFARYGLFPIRAQSDQALIAYLGQFTHEGTPPRNFGELASTAKGIVDRLIHDRADIEGFSNSEIHGPAKTSLRNALHAYRAALGNSNRTDYAGLEEHFLERLVAGRLRERFSRNVRAILIDEYQDTNPLQEAIYFELVRQSEASLSIVGDDDQSLYRFRGATVELFRDFRTRFSTQVPGRSAVSVRYLTENYRSTPEIVSHFNTFITTDAAFAPARVQPPKPLITSTNPSIGIPVLGLFRQTREELALDVAELINDVFRGPGRAIPNTTARLVRHADGEVGDAVFLASSVNELKLTREGPEAKFPRLLRDALAARQIGVFNPRGLALRDIPDVQRLLGTMLECIDPGSRIQSQIPFRNEATQYMAAWRATANQFIDSNPAPNRPHTLRQFVHGWQQQVSQTGEHWPQEWPILELCFKLVSWIPSLRDDSEGQVYLEGIGRCIAQAATFSSFRSLLIFRDALLHEKSVKHALQDIFNQIALNAIDLDEEIMPSVPRNRLPFMTIHQAKGLEFPLVIVDVCSEFKTNHAKQKFKRFPEQPSSVQRLEDELAPHCEIGALRATRTPLSRTFDDLRRLYYVAYSRPQSALLLVGLTKSIEYRSTVRNVATGWLSDGTWTWTSPHGGRRPPPTANSIPLTLL